MQFQLFSIVIYQKISNLADIIMQCDFTLCVICISNNVEYLNKEERHKNSNYIVNLSGLFNAIRKTLDGISCHRHLNI